MNILLELFLTFAKVGLFTFGGGYAMISIIEDTCVEYKRWITHDEMMNMTVIAESTPGPISVNCATYVGFKQAGLRGAIAATFGIALPSFLIIYFISLFLDSFLDIVLIANAFRGIKISVGILILNAAFTMIKKMNKDLISKVILLCAFSSMLLINIFALNFSSISLMIVAGLGSIIAYRMKSASAKGGKEA